MPANAWEVEELLFALIGAREREQAHGRTSAELDTAGVEARCPAARHELGDGTRGDDGRAS